MHQKQLSSVLIADSRTLITAGTDCTVAIWALTSSPKAVDIQSKATLFGHRNPVTVLAASRSFGALVSVSTDGQALLWDLNRLQFVRKLTSGKAVEVCVPISLSPPSSSSCLSSYRHNTHALIIEIFKTNSVLASTT